MTARACTEWPSATPARARRPAQARATSSSTRSAARYRRGAPVRRADRRMSRAGRRPRRTGPHRGRERRPRPRMSSADRQRLPPGLPGRGDAPSRRGRLQHQRLLRHRRLAVTAAGGKQRGAGQETHTIMPARRSPRPMPRSRSARRPHDEHAADEDIGCLLEKCTVAVM